MRYGVVILLVCVSTVVADEKSAIELDYLRACHTLDVLGDAPAAKKAFDALLKTRDLTARDRVLCRWGLARCAIALKDRATAIRIYRELQREAADLADLKKRIDAAIDELGLAIHTGRVQLHYKQGFQFKTGKIAPAQDADVVFSRCAGGISSIDFVAPGGIRNLEKFVGRRKTDLTVIQLYDALEACFVDRFELHAQAEADSRTPESNVFLVRTRDGGWAKFAVVLRGDHANWQKKPAHIVYSYHPDRPVFGRLPANAAQATGPLLFNRELAPTEKEIAARAHERQRQIELAKKGGGTVPDHLESESVLLNRAKFNDYEKATFSFYFGLRDDPGKQTVRNDWDLLYSHMGDGTDAFYVRMVSDDNSTITDLGKTTWNELAKRKELRDGDSAKARAVFGHLYLVHTKDTDANSHSLFRVAAIRPGAACHIEWVTMRTNTLRTSPGLELSDAEKAAIERLLRGINRDGPAFDPR